MKTPTPIQELERAVAICGTQAELARRVAEFTKNPKIKQAHVWNWLNRDEEVPAECVLGVEWAGREGKPPVSRHRLRPDIYGPMPERVAA